MPNLTFQVIHFFYLMGLIIWLGGLIFSIFILAPSVFGTISDRRLAGDVVAKNLDIMRSINLAVVPITFVSSVLIYEMYKMPTFINNVQSLILFLMVLIFLYGTFVVTPSIKRARAALREPQSDMDEQKKLAARFSNLHRTSLNVATGQLVLGVFVVFFS